MGFFDLFKKKERISQRSQTWQELGGYRSYFTSFGNDMYKSDIVRSCIRPLAEHSSKANARCINKSIENLLNVSPNMYMNGKDFLAKVRTKLELMNTAYIYIARDELGRPISFYPIPYTSYTALDVNGNLFIQFQFANGKSFVFAWEDLAVLRKDYNTSDISGDDNLPIIDKLELINTTNQGIANAVKSTSNLRGILKSTKAMLSPEDVKKSKDEFVKDYLGLENEGGIASLDSTQEFTPISMNPAVTDWNTMKEFREDVMRYWGVSNAIITSNYTESQMEAFYDARIEPFLVALSLELTRKCFTERERAFGNQVVYESNRLQYTSNKTKLAMVQLVDRGAMTPNEWRMMFNLAPIEGGDVPIRRLDTAEVNISADPEEEEEDGNQVE